MPDHSYLADVIRVVDGDTVVCKIDLGFRVHAEHSIRLADIDAPEVFRGDPAEREKGMVAKSHLMYLVSQAKLGELEWPFLLKTEKDKQSFGRYIGTLWVVLGHPAFTETTSINEQMVDAGHAEWSTR